MEYHEDLARMERERSLIALRTEYLRFREDGLYGCLRELLRQKDVDPNTTLLVGFFPDGGYSSCGTIITLERSIYEFDLYFSESEAKCVFSQWNDVTASYHERRQATKIDLGLQMLHDL